MFYTRLHVCLLAEFGAGLLIFRLEAARESLAAFLSPSCYHCLALPTFMSIVVSLFGLVTQNCWFYHQSVTRMVTLSDSFICDSLPLFSTFSFQQLLRLALYLGPCFLKHISLSNFLPWILVYCWRLCYSVIRRCIEVVWVQLKTLCVIPQVFLLILYFPSSFHTHTVNPLPSSLLYTHTRLTLYRPALFYYKSVHTPEYTSVLKPCLILLMTHEIVTRESDKPHDSASGPCLIQRSWPFATFI